VKKGKKEKYKLFVNRLQNVSRPFGSSARVTNPTWQRVARRAWLSTAARNRYAPHSSSTNKLKVVLFNMEAELFVFKYVP